jgi:hypothetical protein
MREKADYHASRKHIHTVLPLWHSRNGFFRMMFHNLMFCLTCSWLAPRSAIKPHVKSDGDMSGKVELALEQKEQVERVFQLLPESFVERYAVLKALGRYFHEQMALALQPALNLHFKDVPQDTYEDKAALGSEVNTLLRDLHLTLRDQKTDLPAVLLADFKNAENRHVSRFRFQVRPPHSGKAIKTSVHRQLPDLELMEDPPRRESFARRVSHSREQHNQRE